MKPAWYGRRYPTLQGLIEAAEGRGALVTWADSDGEAIFIAGAGNEPPVIVLPTGVSALEDAWMLAHELGHLYRHAGPRGELFYDKDERAADRWAACALIPAERIRHYRNASSGAFIGALSRHHGELPLDDCPARRLAGRIAQIRLWAMASEPVLMKTEASSWEAV